MARRPPTPPSGSTPPPPRPTPPPSPSKTASTSETSAEEASKSSGGGGGTAGTPTKPAMGAQRRADEPGAALRSAASGSKTADVAADKTPGLRSDGPSVATPGAPGREAPIDAVKGFDPAVTNLPGGSAVDLAGTAETLGGAGARADGDRLLGDVAGADALQSQLGIKGVGDRLSGGSAADQLAGAGTSAAGDAANVLDFMKDHNAGVVGLKDQQLGGWASDRDVATWQGRQQTGVDDGTTPFDEAWSSVRDTPGGGVPTADALQQVADQQRLGVDKADALTGLTGGTAGSGTTTGTAGGTTTGSGDGSGGNDGGDDDGGDGGDSTTGGEGSTGGDGDGTDAGGDSGGGGDAGTTGGDEGGADGESRGGRTPGVDPWDDDEGQGAAAVGGIWANAERRLGVNIGPSDSSHTVDLRDAHKGGDPAEGGADKVTNLPGAQGGAPVRGEAIRPVEDAGGSRFDHLDTGIVRQGPMPGDPADDMLGLGASGIGDRHGGLAPGGPGGDDHRDGMGGPGDPTGMAGMDGGGGGGSRGGGASFRDPVVADAPSGGASSGRSPSSTAATGGSDDGFGHYVRQARVPKNPGPASKLAEKATKAQQSAEQSKARLDEAVRDGAPQARIDRLRKRTEARQQRADELNEKLTATTGQPPAPDAGAGPAAGEATSTAEPAAGEATTTAEPAAAEATTTAEPAAAEATTTAEPAAAVVDEAPETIAEATAEVTGDPAVDAGDVGTADGGDALGLDLADDVANVDGDGAPAEPDVFDGAEAATVADEAADGAVDDGLGVGLVDDLPAEPSVGGGDDGTSTDETSMDETSMDGSVDVAAVDESLDLPEVPPEPEIVIEDVDAVGLPESDPAPLFDAFGDEVDADVAQLDMGGDGDDDLTGLEG